MLSKKTIEKVMDSPRVQSEMEHRASLVLGRSKRVALAAGAVEFSKRLKIERGTRPGSKAMTGLRRRYVRVIGTRVVDPGASLSPLKIMRRAAR